MTLRTTLSMFIQQHRVLTFAAVAARSRHYYKQYSNEEERFKTYGKVVASALFGSVLIASAITDKVDSKGEVNPAQAQEAKQVPEAGAVRPDLPTYRAEEVSKHDHKSSFWVTYKHGVYDVTSFLPSHPGGEQILNAGGLSVEPFWNIYGMHHTPEIQQLLETYRIGNLHADDVCTEVDGGLWALEPRRDPRLLVRSARPFNAETPAALLADHMDTPSELFYVRQHMPVPELDARTHRVTVSVVGSGEGGGGSVERSFSLEELARLPQHTVRAALMCAGNRRTEMNKVRGVKGLSWEVGAVGCAQWRGPLLRDVLLQCGVQPDRLDGRHVILEGADMDATGVKFSTSIPLRAAMAPEGRVLLATAMNGQPLPRDHGRPLRAIVPGAPAVRSVKWLESIRVSDEESASHWHQHDYRSFNASTTWETADWARAPPVYSMPVTSAICAPHHGDTVRLDDDGCIRVKGYAYSGGGASILRVDVSCDGGSRWTQAECTRDPAPPREHYAWTLWEATVPVPSNQQQVEVCVKATDSNFNTQPERFDDIWNIRGILANAYHRITVTLRRE